MSERLFVYGTLGPNRPNEHILTNIGGTWQQASVNGNLVEQGWGAAMGYPGIILSENKDARNANKIAGYIFSSDNLAENWSILDDFEGEGYQRVSTLATLDNNQTIDVYIYALT